MYARVEHGVVRELVETDRRIEELYHPGLFWVDTQNMPGVQEGWTAGQEGFAPPEPDKVAPTLPTVDIAELTRRVDELREQIRMLAPDVAGQHSGEV